MKNQNHTYGEIITQTVSWEKIYRDVVEKKFDLDLNIFSYDFDEIIFFGCGSSFNLSQSALFFTKFLVNGKNCSALPSSELLFNTNIYINKNKKYLIIGFSRSGETTETINVLKQLMDKNNITSLIFSCKDNATIERFSDNYFICRGIVEKSIVMTVSFSSMLFAYCILLTKFLENKKMLEEYNILINFIERNISKLFDNIENYVNANNFKSYFVLGYGFNYGLAVEADLKMKEMSQTPSYSYHLYEFSHGPKALLNRDSLCLVLTLGKSLAEHEKIIKEITDLGSKVLVVGKKAFKNVGDRNIEYLLHDSNFEFDIVESFINIPVFQVLAYFKTLNKKLNPDVPNNLNYTVKI
ncbi:MAG: SIS domain-containing protein [Caldisericia bacterium]|nr:SIS domain-containing protein [Caldisericia bacterium]